jgi:hypothetical protein
MTPRRRAWCRRVLCGGSSPRNGPMNGASCSRCRRQRGISSPWKTPRRRRGPVRARRTRTCRCPKGPWRGRRPVGWRECASTSWSSLQRAGPGGLRWDRRPTRPDSNRRLSHTGAPHRSGADHRLVRLRPGAPTSPCQPPPCAGNSAAWPANTDRPTRLATPCAMSGNQGRDAPTGHFGAVAVRPR